MKINIQFILGLKMLFMDRSLFFQFSLIKIKTNVIGPKFPDQLSTWGLHLGLGKVT